MKLPKRPKAFRDFDSARANSQMMDWLARAKEIQTDVKRNYVVRMEMMAELLLRWTAYNRLTMEDYKSFHPDAKEEDELEHLIQITDALVQVRYEDMSKYVASLLDFFNFVRGRLVQVNQGDKVMPQFMMADTDIGKLVEQIKKIDEIRKKIPTI